MSKQRQTTEMLQANKTASKSNRLKKNINQKKSSNTLPNETRSNSIS